MWSLLGKHTQAEIHCQTTDQPADRSSNGPTDGPTRGNVVSLVHAAKDPLHLLPQVTAESVFPSIAANEEKKRRGGDARPLKVRAFLQDAIRFAASLSR